TGAYDIAVLGWTPPQPHTTAFEPVSRAQLLSSSVLQPVLGNALPEAWTAMRLAGSRDPEQTLLRSRLCIPLVFFHDLWQTSAAVLELRAGGTSAALDIADVHLEVRNP